MLPQVKRGVVGDQGRVTEGGVYSSSVVDTQSDLFSNRSAVVVVIHQAARWVGLYPNSTEGDSISTA